MKKQVLTLCYLLFFCSLSFSIERPDFLNAVANNSITPTIKGNNDEGNFIGKAVEISVQNNTNETIETTVEKGTILESQDPETQDMVVTQDVSLNLAPHEFIDPPLNVFCIEFSKHMPTSSDYFQQPRRKATGDLMKIVNFIDNNHLYNDYSAQLAIWSVTDNITPITFLMKGQFIDNNYITSAKNILDNCQIKNSFSNSYSDILVYILGILLYSLIALLIIKLINRSI